MQQLPKGLDLEGIRQMRRGWQVRMRGYPTRTFRDLLEAIAYRDRLAAYRARGVRELPQIEAAGVTLGALAERLYERERKRLTAEGRAQATFEGLALKLAPWLGTKPRPDALGNPIHTRPIAGITAGELDELTVERALTEPAAADKELAGARLVWRYAIRHGVPVDARVLELRAPRAKTREGIALSYPELEYLASFAQEYVVRWFLVVGTVGLRGMESLLATDSWFDGAALTLTVPPWACKERREKVIQLTTEERDLLAEQQSARVLRLGVPRLLFPRRSGTPFTEVGAFREVVFAGTVKRAIRRFEVDHGREPRWAWWLRDGNGELLRTQRGKLRYGGLEMHDLRRTAISLMREAGMPEEYVAARVGHIDDGKLAMKRYRKVRQDEQRRFLNRLGGGIGHHLSAVSAADAGQASS
jgi:hypothetical protein